MKQKEISCTLHAGAKWEEREGGCVMYGQMRDVSSDVCVPSAKEEIDVTISSNVGYESESRKVG